jgi:flagellar basal body-associated protein FliL
MLWQQSVHQAISVALAFLAANRYTQSWKNYFVSKELDAMQPSQDQPQAINEDETSLTQDEAGKLPEEPQPLLEFPPDGGRFVYPPPPSYYQNMQVPGELPPLPSLPASAQTQAQPGPYQAPSSQSQAGRAAMMYAPPAQDAGTNLVQQPNVQPPAPTRKRSRKWLWIMVSVGVVILLASCGLCGWGFFSIFSTAYQGVSGSLNVVDDYFANLQSQNYVAAYNDLAVHNLTESQFAQQASQADQQNGAILSYTANQPSFSTNPNSGPNLSQFNVAVNVKRQNLSYTVLLTLDQVNGKWKITYYDRI